jgi:transcriptional regulator with XRE-family HTH domain
MVTHPLTLYRERHELTLEELGELVGLSKPSVWRIEAGEQMPSPETAKTIHAKTNIPLWELRPDIWDAPKGRAA